ncbi:MAG TPA: chloride channel protein, partial [Thermoleophilia bacterium]|nr:chloride channel protein [Thermoleophilia bacterium]
FIWAIEVFHRLFFEQGGSAFGFLGGGYVILLPIIGGLIVGPLVHFLAPEAKGHGVPEVMTAMAVRGGRIRPVVILVKALGSAVTIGSGGSVGREGPIVQIGAAIGSVLGQRLKLSNTRILALVGSGAAAGVAATFNAPIAGVMFALEVLLGEYTVPAVSTMVFSAVSASVISRLFLGDHPSLAVPAYSLVSSWELLMYLGLGVVAAFGAGFFVRTLYFAEDLFDDLRFPPYLKPVLGGALLGLLGYFLPQVFGTGFGVVEQTLNGSLALWLLVLLIFAKVLATSLTLGSGFSGGVFAPALFVGAVLGGAYGKVMHGLFPAITATSGAYATVGMAAVFAAAARAPITSIVILFELTLDYRIMLPLMFATVVATVVAARLEPESIYTLKLVRRGIDFRARAGLGVTSGVDVGEVMTPMTTMHSAQPTMSLDDLAVLFHETGHHGVPVVDTDGRFVGVVTLGDLERGLRSVGVEGTVADIMTVDLEVAYPDESLESVLRRSGAFDVGRIPVVDRDDPSKIMGVLRRGDIIRAYSEALYKREDWFHRLDRRRVEHATGSHVVEFDLTADDAAVGHALRDLNLPPECLIISIHRKGARIVPRGDTRLEAGDHLVAVAPYDGGRRLGRCLHG